MSCAGQRHDTKKRNLTRRPKTVWKAEGLLFVQCYWWCCKNLELTLLPSETVPKKSAGDERGKRCKNVLLFFPFFWLSLCSLLLPIHRQNTQIQFDDLFPAGWLHIKKDDEGEKWRKMTINFFFECVLCLSLSSPLSPPPIMRFHFHKNRSSYFKITPASIERVVLHLSRQKLLSILENIREWRHKRRWLNWTNKSTETGDNATGFLWNDFWLRENASCE